MRLLIANHHLKNLAGSELHTLDLCRGFRRAGHEITVFTLKAGSVANTLREEGFQVASMQDLDSLSEQSFDLIYLHHSTCEILLGLVFAGRVPIVRGYLGIGPLLENPVNGNFLSAVVYAAGGARRYFDVHHPNVPYMVAHNVYDDKQVLLGAALKHPRPRRPNFAVVSNHLEPNLGKVLETAAQKGLCSFTHFGLPHKSVPITAELLMPFDAVITIGRTVLFAAALGKPVYVCDIDGSDGWLMRWNFGGARYCGFSGWLVEIKDWSFVEEQLLDTSHWPTLCDLAWICEQVSRDHALSRRVEQLEDFFADIIERASTPVPPPAGYKALLRFIEEKDDAIWGLQNERRKTIDAFKEAATEAKAQTLRAQQLDHRVKELEVESQHLQAHMQRLNRQLKGIKESRTWRAMHELNRILAKVPRRQGDE